MTTCLRILVADGIGTALEPSGVIDPVATRLAAATGAAVERVEWPAAMAWVGGDSTTWAEGAEIGLADLERRVDATDDELILLAYSGGNRIVHDFLDRRPDVHHRVRAVGLMSDPYRPRDRWQRGAEAPGGWGLCGERTGPLPERTVWSAVPGDVITAGPRDSVLRTVADLAAHVPGGLRRDLREVLLAGRFQLAWRYEEARADPLRWVRGFGGRVARAAKDVERYLTGWHTTHYTDRPDGGRSLADRLADELLDVLAAYPSPGSSPATVGAVAIADSTAPARSDLLTTTSGR